MRNHAIPLFQKEVYIEVLKIRLIDAEHAVTQAKKLDWVDKNNVFLVGHSEGGITTARYNPESKIASVTARVIEGWTCNAGWDEYRGKTVHLMSQFSQ